MAKKQQITLEDIVKLGPKKIIILVIAAILLYLSGGIEQQDDSGFVSGTIKRVIDGDTAVVTVDGAERRVRLLGVDTPETVHPNKPVQFYGKEASNFTKEALTGKRVWLEYDASPQDRYNRHLVYIWTAKPKNIDEASMRKDMFNARLLLDGYAKVMIIKPNKRYEELFKKFENEARNAKRGLWSQ
ncbi:MAG: thermonuclease family protein [Synergistaceae bacterium]|nr:thermonuclease family protein [Synergistaceae bacterium]